MPHANSYQPMRRQWHLLLLLPQHGAGITSREANQRLRDHGFHVDKRTTERDLRMLEKLAIALAEGQKPCLWRQAYKQAQHMALTTTEAIGLTLLEQQLKQLLPVSLLEIMEGKFLQAKQLLENDKRFNRHAALLDKIRITSSYFFLQPPQIALAVLASVQQVVAESIPLTVHYQDQDEDQPRQRLIMPLGLLQDAQVTYLIGRDSGSKQNKLFALHRMSNAEVLHGQKMDDTRDFDIDAYLTSGHKKNFTCTLMQLHAVVSESLAKILIESPLSPTMQLHQNLQGKWIVKDTLPDTPLLRNWISIQGLTIIPQE